MNGRVLCLGRLFVGVCRQGAGCPVVDGGMTQTVVAGRGGGVVIRLRPTAGRALVVGVLGAAAPSPAQLRRWLGPLAKFRGGRV